MKRPNKLLNKKYISSLVIAAFLILSVLTAYNIQFGNNRQEKKDTDVTETIGNNDDVISSGEARVENGEEGRLDDNSDSRTGIGGDNTGVKLQNDLGEIRISSEVFTAVTGSAATNCYGVKGMAVRSKTDGLVHLLKRESMAKGVKVYYNEDGTVSIELHIIVENGVNLMAVCRSIMSEVRYVVSKTTGVEVKSVDVCVDSMRF